MIGVSVQVVNVVSIALYLEKQPSRGVFGRKRSENMQQIYRRTPMPKWNCNKVA